MSTYTYAHSCTLLHTFAHFCTLLHTFAHSCTHTHWDTPTHSHTLKRTPFSEGMKKVSQLHPSLPYFTVSSQSKPAHTISSTCPITRCGPWGERWSNGGPSPLLHNPYPYLIPTSLYLPMPHTHVLVPTLCTHPPPSFPTPSSHPPSPSPHTHTSSPPPCSHPPLFPPPSPPHLIHPHPLLFPISHQALLLPYIVYLPYLHSWLEPAELSSSQLI